jgi:hypothetical protein
MKWLDQLILLREEAGEGGSGTGAGTGEGEEGSGGEGEGEGTQEGQQRKAPGSSLLDEGGEESGKGGEEGSGGKQESSAGDKGDYSPFSIYEEGKVSEKFLNSLSEEDKGLRKFFEKYASAEDPNKAMLQGVKNLQYLAGQKALEPLPADAPDSVKEERRQLMAKLNGVPEKPDGYGIKKPEDLPDGIVWPEGSEGKYAEIFHKHGASPELVKEVFALHQEGLKAAEVQMEQQIGQQREAEMSLLKKEYGDRTQQVLKNAMRGASTLGLDPETAKSLATSAAAVKAFAAVVDLVSEDKLSTGGESSTGTSYRDKALDILRNPNNPLHEAYHNQAHPQHDEAVRTRSELNKKWAETKK